MAKHKLNEQDLDRLINDKLSECTDYPSVCQLLQTNEGRNRIKTRIKELIFQDGITDIDTAIANVETELRFTVD